MKIINKWEETFEVNVGDWVGFKCDIEQEGRVKAINKHYAVLENASGFEGGYIGGDTEARVSVEELWRES
jgi:hypothetical protein